MFFLGGAVAKYYHHNEFKLKMSMISIMIKNIKMIKMIKRINFPEQLDDEES